LLIGYGLTCSKNVASQECMVFSVCIRLAVVTYTDLHFVEEN